MLDWLFKLFSRRSVVVEEVKFSKLETTKHYNDFRNYRRKEHPTLCETEENTLYVYVSQTQKSPFAGDENLELAKALLRKNNVPFEKIFGRGKNRTL